MNTPLMASIGETAFCRSRVCNNGGGDGNNGDNDGGGVDDGSGGDGDCHV